MCDLTRFHAVFFVCNLPTAPKTAVKMSLTNWLEKDVMGAAHPFSRAAAAGLGHLESVTNAGVVLLK